MILFGLILSVGVLVDSAIVIVEYADRKMDEGLPRREAFQLAGERMFGPLSLPPPRPLLPLFLSFSGKPLQENLCPISLEL